MTKAVVWQVDLATPSEFLYISDTGLERLIAQSDKTIASIDIDSGKMDWEYIFPYGFYRPPVVLDDVVYVINYYSNMTMASELSDGGYLGYLELQPKDESMFVQIDDILVDPSDTFLVLYHMNQVFVYR